MHQTMATPDNSTRAIIDKLAVLVAQWKSEIFIDEFKAKLAANHARVRAESQARQASRQAPTRQTRPAALKAYTYRRGDQIIETKMVMPDLETDA